MEPELMRKEEAFHKLNAELEEKTNALVKEVEYVMKLQGQLSQRVLSSEPDSMRCQQSSSDFIDLDDDDDDDDEDDNVDFISYNESLPKENQRHYGKFRTKKVASLSHHQNTYSKPRVSSARSLDRRIDVMARSSGLHGKFKVDEGKRPLLPDPSASGDDILPEVGKGMGSEALIRFFRAKAKLLQEEFETIRKEYKKQSEERRHLQTSVQQLEEDRNKWQHQAAVSREALSRQEQTAGALNKKLLEKETENTMLKKEIDVLRKEMKQTAQSYGNNEIRLNRALEDIEKLKSSLKLAKLEEKELREVNRKKIDELTTSIKRSEKQKLELLTVFKKELQLIDNLKKQKAHLEASCVVRFTEEEFTKLLDWNPDT